MGCLRRSAIALGWAVLLCASWGCPDARTQMEGTAPTADLSIQFHVEPGGTQVVSPPGTVTYRVVVDSKGVLNAGVEFELANVPAEITATVNPTRIGETARETQIVVQVPAGTRPRDYDFLVRARLTVSGRGAPDWTPGLVPLRVRSDEAGFSLTCDVEVAIAAGASKTLTCRTIRTTGFNDLIDLSFTNRPGYIMMYPETARVGPDVGGFAFTAVRSLDATTPAFFDLVAVGRSAGVTRQSTIRLHFPSS